MTDDGGVERVLFLEMAPCEVPLSVEGLARLSCLRRRESETLRFDRLCLFVVGVGYLGQASFYSGGVFCLYFCLSAAARPYSSTWNIFYRYCVLYFPSRDSFFRPPSSPHFPTQQKGMATSQDGLAWEKKGPVFDGGPEGSFDERGAGRRRIVMHKG